MGRPGFAKRAEEKRFATGGYARRSPRGLPPGFRMVCTLARQVLYKVAFIETGDEGGSLDVLPDALTLR